jgi:hypothetical protein
MISKLLRCSGVASDKRHDHASGTLMVRPSASRAVIVSSVTSIAIMRGSLFATVFIPGLQNAIQIIEDYPSNVVKVSWRKAVVGAKDNGFQPKLARHAFTAHMHVLGFVAIKAVKEKPVWARNALNRRHSTTLGTNVRPIINCTGC